MSKYIIILSVLAFVILASSALAVNSQPVSKPLIYPNKIYECEDPPTLDGSKSYDIDGIIAGYEWNLEGKPFAQGKIVKVGSQIANHAGTYTFALKVTDDGGASDSGNAVLTVVSNPMPYIKELKYSAISGKEIEKRNYLIKGDVFLLEAVRGESNHGENYTWKYDKSIFQKTGNGNIAKFKVISDSVQSNQEIEVSAVNACKVEGNTVRIKGAVKALNTNSPPTSSIRFLSKAYEGSSFQLTSLGSKTGQGFDEQGDAIVEWKWEITTFGGKVILRSTEKNPQFTIGNSGIFTAHLWVADRFGAIGYSNESFQVIEAINDPPVANATATIKTAVFGQNFTLNGSWSWDPDGRPEDAIKRYKWFDLTYNEELCSSSKPTCIRVLNRMGEHNIKLTVYDNSFPSLESSVTFKVNVISPSSSGISTHTNIPVANEPQKVSGSHAISGETTIDPQEALRSSSEQQEVPTGTKPAPGMEAIAAIIAIIAIATRMKN